MAGSPGLGERGLGAADAEDGGASGVGVDNSSARFNSASISSAFTCRFRARLHGLRSFVSDFSRPRDVLASCRWLIILVRTAHISASHLASRSC